MAAVDGDGLVKAVTQVVYPVAKYAVTVRS